MTSHVLNASHTLTHLILTAIGCFSTDEKMQREVKSFTHVTEAGLWQHWNYPNSWFQSQDHYGVIQEFGEDNFLSLFSE